MTKKNILLIICDQFRYDCIAALGNPILKTPNLDRLVRRGVAFDNAYSTCPVCVPARYTVMTGCEPGTTGCYVNESPVPMDGLPLDIEQRCGPYLAREMSSRGYRTFGIGKFHTKPDVYEDLGFEKHIHTEELWETQEIKDRDGYASYIRVNHPEYNHIDQLHGERTNMYYVPQTSALPAELNVESFVAARTIEELQRDDVRPYFGYVSFVGPHPPCAPPVPYNLMYDPDLMLSPNSGDPLVDSMDEQIRFMNYAIYADDISNGMVRNVKSRYYGEISYIDACIGKILDAVEARPDADDTMICFFSDHGDHLGDHGAWQKEGFFEESTRVPMLISAPWLMAKSQRSQALVCLTDIYGIVTAATGQCIQKDGSDILNGHKRKSIAGTYGRPGTFLFKIMIRQGDCKYIFMANGGREQLFNLKSDPHECRNLIADEPDLLDSMRKSAVESCMRPGLLQALHENELLKFDYRERPLVRIHQFEFSKNVTDFSVSAGNFIASM